MIISAKKFSDKKIFIASGNRGKIKEISELLADLSIEILSTNDIPLVAPAETEDSFSGNALLKARYYAKETGFPALADDSGLCVDALSGAPGVFSARWAEGDNFALAIARIEKELQQKNSSNFRAHFFCALALVWPDSEDEIICEGKISGNLTFPARGNLGFGYDPIFIPDGYNITFAEMQPHEKHKISHRAHAFADLRQRIFA
jgi:XTP/dITP diphosphohydrolase